MAPVVTPPLDVEVMTSRSPAVTPASPPQSTGRRSRHRSATTSRMYACVVLLVVMAIYNTQAIWWLVVGDDVAVEVVDARYLHEQQAAVLDPDLVDFSWDRGQSDGTPPSAARVAGDQRSRVRRARSKHMSKNRSPLVPAPSIRAIPTYHLDPLLGNLTQRTLQIFDDVIQQTFADAVAQRDALKPFYKRVAFMNFFLQDNPFNASYLINNPRACRDDPVDLLIYVHSDPEFCHRRQLIRNTWGSVRTYKGIRTKVIFVLGFRPDRDLQRRLVREGKLFGDLIQGDFRDSYANIRLKDVLGMRWAAEHCGGSRYTMKVDDDVFVNIYKLNSFLGEVMVAFHPQTIACPDLRFEDVPPRKRSSKWYLPPRQYPYDAYPPYCSGMAYVMSTRLAAQLFILSTKVQPLWLDDIWLTGIVANYLDVRHHYLPYTILYEGYELTPGFLHQNYFLILAHADLPELATFRKEQGLAFIRRSWSMLAIDGTYVGPPVQTPTDRKDWARNMTAVEVKIDTKEVYEHDSHAQVQVVVTDKDNDKLMFCEKYFNKR